MAVFDSVPVYRHGVVAVLIDDGYDVIGLDDVRQLEEVTVDLVLFAVRDAGDWDVLRGVTSHHRAVAVLTDGSAWAHWEALLHGAVGVVAREAQIAYLCDVVAAAAAGYVVLRHPVVVELLSCLARPVVAPLLSDEEAGWLETLSRGASVDDLADAAGRSRASMYRLLARIRQRLGVSTNTEAMTRSAGGETADRRRTSSGSTSETVE